MKIIPYKETKDEKNITLIVVTKDGEEIIKSIIAFLQRFMISIKTWK